jgi:23S rRNA (guanosine2251-2'-O)-methyltransferase
MSNHKKTLYKSGTYWLYGIHAVSAVLHNPRRHIHRFLVSRNSVEKLSGELLKIAKKPPEIVDVQAISKLLPEDAVHQGIAVEVSPLSQISIEEWLIANPQKIPLLLLDQVTDPHNVGAILRSAAAFNAGAVILTKDHAPPESAVMAKSASGALELVPMITVTNLVQTMETLKKHGYWCIGLDGEAKETIAQAKLGNDSALVLGAEGKGLRRLTAEHCDRIVRLPISPRMESLNVSNAAAVALYEMSRK